MLQSVQKRSSSLNKSFNFPTQLSTQDQNIVIYRTEQKPKKVESKINAPSNSWREMSYMELLDEAMNLLKENKESISDSQKFEQLMAVYKQFKNNNKQQITKFNNRSRIIKNNIENLITSQNDFKFYLSKIENK